MPSRASQEGRHGEGWTKRKRTANKAASSGNPRKAARIRGGYTQDRYVPSGDVATEVATGKSIRKARRINARSIAAHAKANPGQMNHYSSKEGARQDLESSIARIEAVSNGESIPNPAVSHAAALTGIEPPESLAKFYPRAYREQQWLATKANEGIQHDEVAQFVIDTVATAGLGTGAKLGLKLGAKVGAKAVGKLAAREAEETAAKRVAGTATKRVAKRTTKSSSSEELPSSFRLSDRAVAKVKETPKRIATKPKRTAVKVRRAPAKVKEETRALGTKQGRRAAPKKVAKQAVAHPVMAIGAVGTTLGEAGVDAPGVKQVDALVKGHVEAIKDNPLKVAATTARAIPAILTGPGQTIGAVGITAGRAAQTGLDEVGSPVLAKDYSGKEIVSPVKETTKAQVVGLKDMAGKMLSGDPEKVKDAVENDVGLSLLVPGPAITRVARDSRIYKGARSVARGRVTDRRAAARYKRVGRGKKVKKHPVRDTGTSNEEYILRRTGQKLENHRARVEESKNVTRDKAVGERRGAAAAKPVIAGVRKISKGPKDSKIPGVGTKRRRQQAANAIATIVTYGIPRNKAAAEAMLRKVGDNLKQVPEGGLPPGAISDLTNLKFLRDNPDILDDPGLWEAVDAYKRQAGEIQTSRRKANLAIGDVNDITRPEDRLAEGVQVGTKTIKHQGMDPDTQRRKNAELKNLRAEMRHWDKKSYELEPGTADHLSAIKNRNEASEKATKLKQELRDFRKGSKVADREYDKDVKAVIQSDNLERPAYVKDVEARSSLEAVPNFPSNKTSQKQHRSEGVVRQRGTADRSFDTLVGESIISPRMRQVMHRLTSDFVDRNAVEVGGRRYLTSGEIRKALNDGVLDKSQFAVFHSQHFKQAVLDPHKGEPIDVKQDLDRGLDGDLDTQLAREIKDRSADPGHKYVVVPKERVREFTHQFDSRDGVLRKLNRNTSRAILGYNPSWATAQLFAEGIPAAAAIGANPMRWARITKALHDEKKLSDEDRAYIDALAGQTAGSVAFPKTGFDLTTNKEAASVYRLTKMNDVGKGLMSGVKGEALGKFDRWKGGAFRKAVVAAKVDREMNGFLRGLSGSMKLQDQIIQKIKNKPLAEQQAYLAKHPVTARQLENYLDDVMGNWRALTRVEAKFAPAIAFYPFVRYSLKWLFWAFPKQHPVKASILYFMAQQNSEQLEKLVGGSPQTWSDYAFPVISADGEQSVLPFGARITPALNSLVEAIGSRNPGRLAGGLNPALQIAYTAGSGEDAFGNDVGENKFLFHGLLALNALLSMPAPVRWLEDLHAPYSLRDIRPRATFNGTVVGGQSETSKKFDELDPNKFQRGLGNVLAPQSGADYREEVELERSLDDGSYWEDGEAETDPDPFAADTPKESTYVPFGGTPVPKTKRAKRIAKPYVPFGG